MTWPTTKPLVSIVTPTLQRATYLEQTLRSIRAQRYPRVEHIVVDGGSTDGTIELLQRYSDTYNLRWVSEPDAGMYDAINKGMRMANGDVLAYLNSDDLYFPWTLERVVNALSKSPDVGVVYGDAIRIDTVHDLVVPVFMPPYRDGPSANYGSLLQPCVHLRREVYETLGGFDSRLGYVADMEFWLRAAARFTFLRIPEVLALEVRHPGMLSVTRREELATEDFRMRMGFRHGIGATWIGRLAGYLGWHFWSGKLWIDFARAVRGGGAGWEELIDGCRPDLSATTILLGVMPSKGSRFRNGIRWAQDPLSVASPGGRAPE